MVTDVDANNKDWWAPVWRGLVCDPGGKHHRKIKNAVWLYLYLLLHAGRRSGFLVRKVRTISADMAVPRDTVLRWLAVLRRGGYIRTRSTGRCLEIQIANWKRLPGVANPAPQKWDGSNASRRKTPTLPERLSDRIPVYLSGQRAISGGSNDISIKKIILSNDNADAGVSRPATGACKAAQPLTSEDLLAADLAWGLRDPEGLARYRSYARRYPETLLRRALSEVRQTPPEPIRGSRAALFAHLVQTYAQTTSDDPGR